VILGRVGPVLQPGVNAYAYIGNSLGSIDLAET